MWRSYLHSHTRGAKAGELPQVGGHSVLPAEVQASPDTRVYYAHLSFYIQRLSPLSHSAIVSSLLSKTVCFSLVLLRWQPDINVSLLCPSNTII